VIRTRFLELDARWSARLRIAERSGPLRSFAIVLAHSGDSWFWFAALAFIAWRSPPPWRAFALRTLAAVLALAFVVLLLKFTVRRRRPEGDWGAIYRRTDPHSFPSGHAARATLLAILAAVWAPTSWGVTMVAWAPFVCMARVVMGVHYLSDVLVGVLLGAAAAALTLL
jgi:undecaprenyl-diphosphatase